MRTKRNTLRELQDRLGKLKRASKAGKITREKHDRIRGNILAKIKELQGATHVKWVGKEYVDNDEITPPEIQGVSS